MNGDEMDRFAIEIAWLIVRMAKQSSVATRRDHDAVNGPWVSTHGSACQYPCRRVATFEKSGISYAASLPVFNKRFVFAHVFLQEVTEGTEKLCTCPAMTTTPSFYQHPVAYGTAAPIEHPKPALGTFL
jgi:hypothetical protein